MAVYKEHAMLKRSCCPLLVIAALAVHALLGRELGAQSTSGGPLVVLVRHAEKAATPADDPSLTPAGIERAKALEQALASASVSAIITTEFKRTRETAAPLAQKTGVTPEVVAARGAAPAAHIQAVVAAIRRHASGVVLVVGHSNTVPAIIAALGGERMRDLCEPDYDNLFILSRDPSGVRLLKTRFGAPDNADLAAPNCTVMR
jgi:phosphohistidine phosphatase SixA